MVLILGVLLSEEQLAAAVRMAARTKTTNERIKCNSQSFEI